MTKPAANRFKSAGTLLLSGGVAVVVFGLLYFTFTPKLYRSTAHVQVEKRDWVREKAEADAQNSFDPELAPAECQVLRSNAFLDRAIEKLGLTSEWGKRYHQGAKLTEEEVRERLRSKADIHALPNSSIIAITVTSEAREDTARIANELANLYVDYRTGRRQRQDYIHERINSLQQQFQQSWDDENKKIAEAQSKVNEIALQLRRTQGTNTTLVDADSFRLLQTKRADLEKQAEQLRAQLAEFKSLTQSELRRALSSDSETNALLNASLTELNKAQVQLANVETDHGPDSLEVKHAKLSVDQLEQHVVHQVKTAIAMKEFNLSAIEAAVEDVDAKLKNTRPLKASDMDVLQTSGYQEAMDDLKRLQSQRDELQSQMNAAPQDGVMPVVITAQLTDPAEAPSRPFSPDPHIGMGTVIGGGLLAICGIGLCALSSRKNAPTRKN